jgi:hypothetical protein
MMMMMMMMMICDGWEESTEGGHEKSIQNFGGEAYLRPKRRITQNYT